MTTAFKRRPYQNDQLTSTKADFDAGVNSLLVCAATGTGKTEYFSQLPTFMNLGGQMFVLVHRDELATQAAKKIKKRNPDLKVGIEMGKKYADPSDDVVVASVQTLGREGSARIHRFDPNNVKIVVTDEAHHSTADTYISVYDYFEMMADKPGKLLVGVTATPGRADGVALAKVYKKVTHSYPLRQAIEEGFLCDIRAIRIRTGTDISKVKSSRGDFQTGELSDAVNTPERNQLIVAAWMEHALGRPTVGFCVDIQHSKDLAETFRHFGVKAEAVWGDDPDRAWKLARHRGGQDLVDYYLERGLFVPNAEDLERLKIDVITNCDVLTEGYDDWRVSCIIMARPTKSQTKFVQCIGRGTRLQEGVENMKQALAENWALQKVDCLVLDPVDSTSRNSLVTVPSIFGMAAEMDLKGESAVASLKKIEAAQNQNPNIDFSNLESLDQIKVLIEEANIWEVKFPDEVVAHSKLSWHRAFDGSFSLQLPNDGRIPPRNEKITIRQNVMEQWEVKATIKGVNYKGVRNTIEEAFVCGDNLLMKVAGDAVNVLSREGAAWHEDPATDGQIRRLKRLLKGKSIPANITKGKASKMIGSLVAAMVTGESKDDTPKRITPRKKAA